MSRASMRLISSVREAVSIARGESKAARVHAPDRRIVEACAFELPPPISTNKLWMPSKHGGIIRTPEYRNWLTEAGHKLNRQAKERVIGHYALYLTVTDKSRADLGNCEKAVSDLLEEHGIVQNDRLCTQISVSWGNIVGMFAQLMASKSREAA